MDKIPFYDAVITVCQAVRDFALRYHRLALEKAETTEAERRDELLEIARICKKVPYISSPRQRFCTGKAFIPRWNPTDFFPIRYAVGCPW